VPRDVRLQAPDPESREGLVGSFNAAVGRLGWAAMGETGPRPEGREPGDVLLHTAVLHEDVVRRLDEPVTGGVLEGCEPGDLRTAAVLEGGASPAFDEVCRRYQRASAALAAAFLEIEPERFTVEATPGQWVRACTRHLVAHALDLESPGA
jgi:hypothetical protein